jgi:hypothetical protein
MIEYLTIDEIIKKYDTNSFYLAHFNCDSEKEEMPFSDKPPYKARLKWYPYELSNRSISICSKYGELKAVNPYFRYMVSDNIEELHQEYKKKKQEWINSRREYLVSQIKLIDEMEKKCF